LAWRQYSFGEQSLEIPAQPVMLPPDKTDETTERKEIFQGLEICFALSVSLW
jgi:hypothetical protein